jgi:16S rRNA (guanine527-N7)-methyltransferase
MFHVKHTIVHTNVSRETLVIVEDALSKHRSRLEEYADKLLEWNKRVNLISRDINRGDLINHIHHSLMIMYSSAWVNKDLVIVDAGSGGGLPGIPLGIVSNNSIRLIDVVEKKMLACKDIIRGLKLSNIHTLHGNIAELSENDFVYVTKHAFKLADFVKITDRQNYKAAIFLKGDDYIHELAECTIPLSIEVIRLDHIHKEHFYKGKCIITLRKLNEKPGTPSPDFTYASIGSEAN